MSQVLVPFSYETPEPSTLYLVDAGGGAETITLPHAAQAQGTTIIVIRLDSGSDAITVFASSGDTVAGGGSALVVQQHKAYTFVSLGGTEWIQTALIDFTAPAFIPAIKGSAEDLILTFGAGAGGSAENALTIENAAGGSAPTIAVSTVGLDADIDLKLVPFGAGVVREGTTRMCVDSLQTIPNSAGTVLAGPSLAEYNTLLAALRLGRIIS